MRRCCFFFKEYKNIMFVLGILLFEKSLLFFYRAKVSRKVQDLSRVFYPFSTPLHNRKCAPSWLPLVLWHRANNLAVPSYQKFFFFFFKLSKTHSVPSFAQNMFSLLSNIHIFHHSTVYWNANI